MNRRTLLATALLLAVAATSSAVADNDPVGTIFTYQGRLTEGGEPVTGQVNLVYRLFAVPADGVPLNTVVANNFEIGDDGVFTIDLDFGASFSGAPRWLEIEVNSVVLAPRQPILAAPYAMVATTAANVPIKAVVGNYTGITGVGTLDALNVSGNVGIGTTSPTNPLHVRLASVGQAVRIESVDASNNFTALGVTHNGTGPAVLGFNTGSGVAGDFRTSGGNTSAAVRGLSQGGGAGVKGEATIVSGIGVWGHTQLSGGYAGYFTGGQNYFEGPIQLDAGLVFNAGGGGGSQPMIRMFSSGTSNPDRMVIAHSASFPNWGLQYQDSADDFVFLGNGTQRIRIDLAGSDSAPTGGGHLVIGNEASTNISLDNNEIMARNNGTTSTLHLNADGGFVHVGQNSGGSARLVTPVLEITGGSDLSERFDVAAVHERVPEPGMVVCIDPRKPGTLVLSSRAYDRTVAGVISGANGIKTGMMMGQEGSEADGAFPVALTGRVYVMVDARGAGMGIQPGDLLTTSDTPGHAMKARDRSRSHGAILGKAMSALPEGERGLVLVLVTLQ